jgi:dihydroorotase
MSRVALALAVVAWGWLAGAPAAGLAQPYDLVVANGRVIDPETRLDAVRNVGLTGGRIVAISPKPLAGRKVIDAAGRIVAPGFIDLNNHSQTEESFAYDVLDGVTTSLELEIGTADVDAWYRARAGRSMVNYGVAIGHLPIRVKVLSDPRASELAAAERSGAMFNSARFLPAGAAAREPATEAQLQEILDQLDDGLRQGALGVGLSLGLTPGAAPWEVRWVFEVAGKSRAPVFARSRYTSVREPTSSLAGLLEVLAAAAISGAPLHLCELTTTGLARADQLLETIAAARGRGLDVSAEASPYGATATDICGAMFDGDWQAERGLDYGALYWPATRQPLDEASFQQRRRECGLVVVATTSEEKVAAAIVHPATLVASAGDIAGGVGHPRTTGTYAMVLGEYVRERRSLTLMEAIRKMTLMPAQRLERFAPAMKRKGRLQVGADADLTVLDLARVRANSTYENPALPSEGFTHVLVNGVLVVEDGKVVSGAVPGQPVRNGPARAR